MPLKGNLRDFTLTQLLNLVNLARKTGTLVIEGPGEIARVAFKEGRLAFAEVGSENSSLSGIISRSKYGSKIPPKVIEDKLNGMSDKEMALFLMNAGYMRREDILEELNSYCLDVVRRLFAWVEGFFRFEPEELPPPEKILIGVDLESLIIEGSRQLKEYEQLQDEIPSLDMALKFTDRPGTNIRNVNLSAEEWRVVSYVNPKNTIRQISRVAKMNDLEIRKVTYGLLQAGLVEIVRPGGAPIKIPGKITPEFDKEETTNTLSRLISRIRSL